MNIKLMLFTFLNHVLWTKIIIKFAYRYLCTYAVPKINTNDFEILHFVSFINSNSIRIH